MTDREFDSIIEDLEYANYTAHKQFMNELAVIAIKCNEAGYIMETDVASVAKSYIRKIVGNIQVAWNKFKEKMQHLAWDQIKKKYSKQLKMDRPLKIQEVNDSDVLPRWSKVKEFISTPAIFKIDASQSDLDETAIIKQIEYFREIDKFSKQALTEVVNKNCFIKLQPDNEIGLTTNNINGDSGKECVIDKYVDEFESEDNLKLMSNIENLIKNFNTIEKTAEQMLTANAAGQGDNQVSTSQNSANDNGQVKTSEAMFDIIYNKAETMILNELKTVDSQDPEGKEAGKGGGNDVNKYIQRVFKVMTTLLTVYMNTLNKANVKSLQIIHAYVKNAAKYSGPKPANNNAGGEEDQVEV